MDYIAHYWYTNHLRYRTDRCLIVAVANIKDKPELKVLDTQRFGSYGGLAPYSMSPALDKISYNINMTTKPGPSDGLKVSATGNGVPATKNESVPWFREIGLTSDPISMKEIWSDKFKKYNKTRKWGETYQGRLAMRGVSRLVVGSAVFSAMGIYATKSLDGYNNSKDHKAGNIPQYIARGIDNTIGKLIQWSVSSATRNKELGLSSVLFRQSSDFGYKHPSTGKAMDGRSLGHEIVDTDFAFAAMSFADYMTRYIIGIFDPNSRTKWLNKDRHLDLLNGLREVRHAIFKGVTYAAGEDMFVAVPYAFYGEAQSKLINRVSPGFKKDFDMRKLGTSIKVNHKGEAIGNYNLEGILDFTGRFTAYNIGTKIFRDLYGNAEEKLDNLKHGVKSEHNKANKQQGNIISRGIKYLFVTVSKTMFIMIPSAFLFGTLRVPASKVGRVAIDPEGNILNDSQLKGFSLSGGDVFSTTHTIYIGDNKMPWYNRLLNPIGKYSVVLGDQYEKGLRAIGVKDNGNLKGFARGWAGTGIPYLAYFGLKSDLMAPFLDTNRTNFVLGGFYSSLGNLIKSIPSFDGKKIKSSLDDTREWVNEAGLAMIKQPSLKYERQIQVLMNDEGYKVSNEGLSLYQDTYEKRHQILEKEKQENELTGHAVNFRPAYMPQHKSESITVMPQDKQVSYAQKYNNAAFSPASMIKERREKGDTTAKSLLDRAIVMSGSATIH